MGEDLGGICLDIFTAAMVRDAMDRRLSATASGWKIGGSEDRI
jgi:hypothetical protein